MSLKGRKFLTKQITLSDGGEPVAVRGLSLSDISQLVLANREEAIEIFTKVMDKKNNLSVEDLAKIADQLLLLAPNLTACIVASGTGDIDAYTDVLGMPVGDQLVLLYEIGDLTFKTVGSSKKVLEIVISMAGGAKAFLAK